MKIGSLITFSINFTFNFLMWFFSKDISGHVELWDSPSVYFLSLALTGLIARYFFISCFLGCVLGQYAGLSVIVGESKFFAVGIVFILASALLTAGFSLAMSKTFYKQPV